MPLAESALARLSEWDLSRCDGSWKLSQRAVHAFLADDEEPSEFPTDWEKKANF
jgi:hypothetical protein